MMGLVLGILLGFGGHYTKRPIERRFGSGWSDLAKYALGIVLVFPVIVVIGVWLGMTQQEFRRFVSSYWLGALSVGAGVGLGYTLDK